MMANNFIAETCSVFLSEYNVLLSDDNIYLYMKHGTGYLLVLVFFLTLRDQWYQHNRHAKFWWEE
jgi:hypothetical protein